MKLLRVRSRSTGDYAIVVWLDPTRVDLDGQPDKQWVYRLTWPGRPDGMTHAAYLQQERPAIRQLCLRVLADLEATEGAALPGEGDDL